jgi:hypothetical protein
MISFIRPTALIFRFSLASSFSAIAITPSVKHHRHLDLNEFLSRENRGPLAAPKIGCRTRALEIVGGTLPRGVSGRNGNA